MIDKERARPRRYVCTLYRSRHGNKKKENPFNGAGTWNFGKLAEKAIDNWSLVLVAVSGSGLMTYLAAVSVRLKPYGPVAPGAVALLTVLLLTLS